MPDAAVINTGSGGGGAVGGIPGGWRTVVIAGGALAALVAVLLQKRGASGSDGAASAGGLSTSANVALGQVAYNQLQAQGEARTAFADITGRLEDLQHSTDAGFGGLWTQGQATRAAIVQTGAMNEVIGRQIWGHQQGVSQDELLEQQRLIFGSADMTIANTLAAPPPWLTSSSAAEGSAGTENVADEPLVTVP